jgi:hypothetical protein
LIVCTPHAVLRAPPAATATTSPQLIPRLDKVAPGTRPVGRLRGRPECLYADRGYDHDKYWRLVRAEGTKSDTRQPPPRVHPATQRPPGRRGRGRTAEPRRPAPDDHTAPAASHLRHRPGQRRHVAASADGATRTRHPRDDHPLRHPRLTNTARGLRPGDGQDAGSAALREQSLRCSRRCRDVTR